MQTIAGPPGPGLAAGGTTGQIPVKASATDFDTTWTDPRPFGIPFGMGGPLVTKVGNGTYYNDSGVAQTIVAVRASVGTAPTGQAVIVDVNKNGTTIFTNQANRPTIAPATKTDLADAIDVTTLEPGAYLSVDVDQVGSPGTTGADLTVTITLR